MLARLRTDRGFSLAEILIVIALLGILASVVLLNLGSSDIKAKESNLRSNAQALRAALDMYKSDHGFYPGATGDVHSGAALTEARFRYKLTRFTRADGAYSTTKNTNYKYGPYLKEFPEESFTNSSAVTINTADTRLLSAISTDVSNSASGTGGWYYEVNSGNVVPNLGQDYPDEYAGF